jgi:hypothetical protein
MSPFTCSRDLIPVPFALFVASLYMFSYFRISPKCVLWNQGTIIICYLLTRITGTYPDLRPLQNTLKKKREKCPKNALFFGIPLDKNMRLWYYSFNIIERLVKIVAVFF